MKRNSKNFEKEISLQSRLSQVEGVLGIKEHSKEGKLYDNQNILKREGLEYMVLDYYWNGDLLSLLEKEKKFPEKVVRHWFWQLLFLLKRMDEKSVYHRDLKPENFLLDENFDLILSDFGSATSNLKSSKKVGTTVYMSPEVYKGIEYNSLLNDIYSSVVIAFVLITGLVPQDQWVPFYLSL